MTLQLAIKITADASSAKAGATETQQAYDKLNTELANTGRGATAAATALGKVETEASATGAAASAAGTAFDRLDSGLERAERGATATATALGRTATEAASAGAAVSAAGGAINRLDSGLERAERGAKATATALGRTASEASSAATALGRVGHDGQSGANVIDLSLQRAARSAKTARGELSAMAGQLEGWQKQQLMAQGFDVFTSLSSGMNPFTVAAQQGPQIIQVYGGFRQALQGALSVLTPMRVALGATTGLVVAGAVAWNGYLNSTKEVQTAANGIGRNLGTTAPQLEGIAQAAAEAGNVSVTQARSMEAAFLRTGQIGVENFSGLIGIAKDFAATMGTDVDTATGQLATLFADPAKGAAQLQQLGLLDGATARLVTRLASQNETTKAQSTLLAGVRTHLANAAEATTAFGRAADWAGRQWENMKDKVGGGLAGLFSGPDMSIEAQLRRVQDRLEVLRKQQPAASSLPPGNQAQPGYLAILGGNSSAETKLLEAQEADLQEQQRLRNRIAANRQMAADEDKRGTAAVSASGESAVNAELKQRIELEDRLKRLQAGAKSSNLSDQEQKQVADAIEATTRALEGLTTARQRQTEMDRIDLQIQEARDPIVKADLVARREQLRLAGEETTAAKASIEVERARQKSLEESAAASRRAAREILDSQRDQMEQLRLEMSLIGKSAGERSRATAALEAEQRIRSSNINATSAEADAIRRSAQEIAAYTSELERRKDAFSTFQRAGESAFDALGDALAGKKVDFASLMQDINRQMIQLAVINPLKNMAFGTNYGTAGDLMNVFMGGSSNPLASAARAVGTMQVTAATVVVNGGLAGIGGGALGFASTGTDGLPTAPGSVSILGSASAVGGLGVVGGLSSLASSRSSFSTELANPDMVKRLFAMTNAEVGGQGPEAQQAFMESIFNRASARNMSLDQVLNDRKYFPQETFSNADRYMSQDLSGKYGSILDQVRGGSNISNYATGNASGTVGFAGGPQTFAAGGERFGIEGPDMSWVKQMQGQMQQYTSSVGNAANATTNFGQSLGGTASSLTQAAQATGQAASSMGGVSTSLTQAGSTTSAAASSFAGDLSGALSGIANSISKAIGGIFGGGTGFALGGIMTSSGPMQLAKYAFGGIADRPQLALFGEGA
ncbi:MAG: phage tail length tape measure family protein [Rhizobiales bacterium]|nr:phage tail length tape measure family protein [Hyphomicrobiales bacterium]